MMRVPLLVAMAALVYERNIHGRLPATRGDLYREYISLLLSARPGELSVSTNIQEATPFSSSLHTWLSKVMPELLVALAIARVDDAGCSLILVARDWVREHFTPKIEVDVPDWHWIGVLHSDLISTSVLVAAESDVEFMHQSIAEYLAADPQVCSLSGELLQNELRDPATRDIALFRLARGGQQITPIIRNFLEKGDPVSAGHVLAEGFAVESNTREATLSGLLDLLRDEDPSAMECISILAELAIDESVRRQLVRVVEDDREGPWTRALLADTLAELDPQLGMRLLREVARDSSPKHQQSRVWASQRLVIRGDASVGHGSMEVEDEPSRYTQVSDRITEHTRRSNAQDVRTVPEERLREAIKLADRGDPVGMEILRQIAWNSRLLDISERRSAAQALMDRGDLVGLNVLQEIAKDERVDASERRLAAQLLDERDEHEDSNVLKERARDRGMPPWQRRKAAELLLKRAERVGIDVLHSLVHDDNIDELQRYEAAQSLARYEDPVGVAYLELVAGNRHSEYHQRYSAAAALNRNDITAGARALEELAADRDSDPWERRMAAQALLFSTGTEAAVETLKQMAADETISAEERYESACLLLENAQPAGLEVLRKLARDNDNVFQVRYRSSSALVERGDRVGIDVLRDLASDTEFQADDRRLAARQLAEYHDEVGLRALRNLARSRDVSVDERRQAALALANWGILKEFKFCSNFWTISGVP